MSRVLVTRRLPDGVLSPLDDAGHAAIQPVDGRPMTHSELVAAAPDVDAIICLLTDRIDGDVLRAGASGRLRAVGNVAVGVDNIDLTSADALGITVCNTPGVLDESTADLTLLLMLAASRCSSGAEADLRDGRWTGWDISDHLGRDLHGAVLGLVGFGRIARAVARRAGGFDMEVIHHARHDTGVPGFVPALEDLLDAADVVSLHVPGTPGTRGLIGRAELRRMGPDTVLVNTARGSVVDEQALAAALEAGEIFAAGLDVFASEPAVHPDLLRAPRTVLLPHIGSATVATRRTMCLLAVRGVCEVLAGRVPANAVGR